MTATQSPARPLAYVAATGVVLLLAAASLTILVATPGTLRPKVDLVLALIGLYGLGIGFLRRASAVAPIGAFEGVTSPNVGQYLRANLLFAAFLPLLASAGLAPSRQTEDSRVLVGLGRVLWIPVGLLLVLYAIIQVVIIAPLTYPAWVVASALVAALKASSQGAGIRSTDGGGGGGNSGGGVAWVRDIVLSDEVRSKAFIVGTPALLLSIIGHVLRALLG